MAWYADSSRLDTMILYHNPRCSKSRQALALLEQQAQPITVRLYMSEPISKSELLELLSALDLSARELVRSNESAFKTAGLQQASSEELIEAMLQDPRLIERPIFKVGTRAVIGRPPERVLELL